MTGRLEVLNRNLLKEALSICLESDDLYLSLTLYERLDALKYVYNLHKSLCVLPVS